MVNRCRIEHDFTRPAVSVQGQHGRERSLTIRHGEQTIDALVGSLPLKRRGIQFVATLVRRLAQLEIQRQFVGRAAWLLALDQLKQPRSRLLLPLLGRPAVAGDKRQLKSTPAPGREPPASVRAS